MMACVQPDSITIQDSEESLSKDDVNFYFSPNSPFQDMDNGSEYTPDKRKMTENSKEESKETRGSRSKDKSKKLP